MINLCIGIHRKKNTKKIIKMTLNYIPRVTQLDASHLDYQVEEILKQYIYEATKFLQPGLLQRFQPELELAVRTWIFKYSVYDNRTSFGQQMLSLSYRKENFSKSKLFWYYGYTVGIKYFKDRAIYSFTSNVKIQNFINTLETFQVLGDILNFLRFIYNGKHPILIDFILGLQMSAEKLTREDLTDFSWTRELLWHNSIELFGTVLSLMNMFGAKRKLSNFLKYVLWKKHRADKVVTQAPSMDLNTVCAFCSSLPVLPHTMGCSHIFCFYCIQSNKMADADFPCPKCYFNGQDIKQFCIEEI